MMHSGVLDHRVIDPHLASDRLDDHPHALTGVGVNSQATTTAPRGLIDRWGPIVPQSRLMTIPWLSTAWFEGAPVRSVWAPGPARMSDSDASNSQSQGARREGCSVGARLGPAESGSGRPGEVDTAGRAATQADCSPAVLRRSWAVDGSAPRSLHQIQARPGGPNRLRADRLVDHTSPWAPPDAGQRSNGLALSRPLDLALPRFCERMRHDGAHVSS
jgi:hypothetical protein